MKKTKARDLDSLRDEMLAVLRGERDAPPRPQAVVFNVFSDEARELVRVIHSKRPKNVAELAELTGRAQSNVSRSLHHLANHNLIRLVRNGREVRPVPVAAKLTWDLRTGTYETTPIGAE